MNDIEIGQHVIYEADSAGIFHNPSSSVCAVVVGVMGDEKGSVNLCYRDGKFSVNVSNVPYSQQKEVGTWHYE